VNPVIGLLLFERTPAALQARVFGLVTATAWAGLPLGGLLAGWAVTAIGLRPALLVTSAAYLMVALTPVIRHRTWRVINRPPDSKTESDKTEADESEPRRTESDKAEPGKAEPGKVELGKTEPTASTEPTAPTEDSVEATAR
jgi:hypothetical protein